MDFLVNKVVITVKDGFWHKLFLARSSHCIKENVAAIFIQEKNNSSTSPGSRLKQKVIKFVLHTLFQVRRNPTIMEELRTLCAGEDLNDWQNFSCPIIRTNQINSSFIRSQLVSLSPDLILVMGSAILKNEWISLPRLGTINMHYGILPWYRSTYSTQFAIYQENYGRIGATIHYIDAGIDTGPIIRKIAIDTQTSSTIESVLARIYNKGITALLDIAQTSLDQDRRLEVYQESAPNSYYSLSRMTPLVTKTAALRIRCQNAYRWPGIIQAFIRPPTFRETVKGKLDYRNLQSKSVLQNGIYILLYHSIRDSNNPREWEEYYDKIQTDKNVFTDHLEYMSEHAIPIRLSEVPALLRNGGVDRPYFAITFDDGYANIVQNAKPLLDEHNIKPMVFVNAAFADGEQVYYRVLAAILVQQGYEIQLRQEFEKKCKTYISTSKSVFAHLKDEYVYRQTETVVACVWQQVNGDKIPANVHLNWDELRNLQREGWEIGNHTRTHAILSKCSFEQQEDEIITNFERLEKENLSPVKWLSYPNGYATHVNRDTYKWLLTHPEWNAIFACGGVNMFYSRTEWLRIALTNETLKEFKDKLKRDTVRTISLL